MTHVTGRLTAKNRDQLRNPIRSAIEYGLPLPFLVVTDRRLCPRCCQSSNIIGLNDVLSENKLIKKDKWIKVSRIASTDTNVIAVMQQMIMLIFIHKINENR